MMRLTILTATVAAAALCAGAQDGADSGALLRSRPSGGPILEQAPDGSWLQTVHLRGFAPPGWEGLRQAFQRQVVTIECPSSPVRVM